MNDDSTDKLFQEGANRYEFAYKPEAWEQMEQLLEQDARKRQHRWLLGGLLVVLLSIGGWWLFFQPVPDVSVPAPTTPQAQASASIVTQEPSNSIPPSATDAGSSPPQKKEAVAPAAHNLNPKANSTIAPTKVVSNTTQNTATSRTTSAIRKPVIETNPTATILPADEPDLVLNKTEPSTSTAGRSSLPAIEPLIIEPAPIAATAAVIPQPTPNIAEDLVATKSNAGLFVAAGGGTVFGNGGKANFGQGQERFGLQLGYRFRNRFGLQLGGYFGGLSYKTAGKKYKANEEFWTDGVVATLVEAECKILEIPLLFSYHLNGHAVDGLYFAGGLTSYFFIREEFDFNYDVDLPNQITSWREDNTNQHIFGYGQFNIGYEKKLGRQTALQLESFVQLPLNGIGHGKVNVYNVGVSANLLFGFRR